MNRLQKKCTVASVLMHVVLLLALLVGPLFLMAEKRSNDLPILKVIPGHLVDDAMFGGGSPTAPPPATPAVETPARPPAPLPTPVVIEPVKPAPAVETPPKPLVDPPKERNKPAPEPEPVVVKEQSVKPTVPKSKPTIKVDTKITPRTPKEVADARTKAVEEEAKAAERAQAKAAADARRKAIQNFASRLDGAESSLKANLSTGTTVEIQGPGGAAYANYGQAIKSIYDAAWIAPTEASEAATGVRVEVVIARDGTVISDRILKRSGDSALDRSVQNALDRVSGSRLPAFPSGNTESRQTFIINFNLKEKLEAG